jgi:peptidoglycan/xylan/chitin deacetylase (PgdA/CDA1 family)
MGTMSLATFSRAVPPGAKRPFKRLARRWYESRRGSRPPALTILMLHEVHPLGFTPRQFEGLLEHLAGRNALARLDEAGAALRAGRELSRDTVVLTFDDGLRNNLTYAAPLLERYRAKATFFVIPGLIESREWIWTHEALARLRQTPADRLSRLAHLRAWAPVPSDNPARQGWARRIVDAMKRMPESGRADMLDALRRSALGPLDATLDDERYALMDWDDLRRLDRDLIELGSHSYSHTMLQGLPSERLEQEIAMSRDVLAAATARPIVSFCYPDGCFDDRTLAVVRRCYAQAVTATDPGPSPDLDLHRLPRTFVSDDEDTLFRLARSRSRLQRRGG